MWPMFKEGTKTCPKEVQTYIETCWRSVQFFDALNHHDKMMVAHKGYQDNFEAVRHNEMMATTQFDVGLYD